MADPLREVLGSPVRDLRELLTSALRGRLLGYYGIDASTGEVRAEDQVDLDEVGRERRTRILEVLAHFQAAGAASAAAAERFVRESAFTHLNRLVALKMLEDPSRRVMPRCLAGGRDAPAFRTFRRIAPELVAASGPDEGRSFFLELVFDEIEAEVGDLLGGDDPRTLLDLAPDVLERAVARLDDPALVVPSEKGPISVWALDETLGWVYQLFTTVEARKKSRKDYKSGPPNSDHLAFRNQFYTPRYVVEFLVDNTLGRLWCEMHPDSPQRERRRLLCVPPGPIAEKREPRDLKTVRLLDPACGSGHFLLYAFDVLAEMYAESGTARGEIPDLILRHNLRGIEIDRRAAQLAALALFLKAKKYEPTAKVPPAVIVLAEPMPGEDRLWQECLTTVLDIPAREFLRHLRELLKNADEIGALYPMRKLRDQILRGETTNAGPKKTKRKVASKDLPTPVAPKQELAFTFYDWTKLEASALEALHRLTATAEGASPTRRLFTSEGRHDLSLVRALLDEYDVVLMNPPFGAPVPRTRELLKGWYPLAGDKTNLYATFVEQGLRLLRPDGFLGAITDRSGFFITTFQGFREEIVLGLSDVEAFADLGFGVLGGADEPAKVEAAAYALRRRVAASPGEIS
jgi:hypothetical protein